MKSSLQIKNQIQPGRRNVPANWQSARLRLQSRARPTNLKKTVEDGWSSTHRRIVRECTMTRKSSSPRIEARESKLRALTLTQIKSLRRWLTRGRLTYGQARTKLRKRFGVSLSTGTMCRFWYTYCQPAAPPMHDRQPRVFLDAILQSARPIRVRILENNSRLSFKVGRVRTRGLNKKPSFIIGPAAGHKSK